MPDLPVCFRPNFLDPWVSNIGNDTDVVEFTYSIGELFGAETQSLVDIGARLNDVEPREFVMHVQDTLVESDIEQQREDEPMTGTGR